MMKEEDDEDKQKEEFMGYRRFRQPLPLGDRRVAIGDRRAAISDCLKFRYAYLHTYLTYLTYHTLQVQNPIFGTKQVP